MTRNRTLYNLPLKATRSGPLFHAHAYPTKISPESIALLIACHTKPGATVFDGFGGSGTTAVASLLCSKPSKDLIAEADRLGLSPKWGPRSAVVYEISGLGSFIAEVLCSRPDPGRFEATAKRILKTLDEEYGWLYSAAEGPGQGGTARYFIWTDHLQCPKCRAVVTLWDGCVHLQPASISPEFRCPQCRKRTALDDVPRLMQTARDDLIGQAVRTRARSLARVDGATGTRHWSREPISADTELLERIDKEPIPRACPIAPMLGKGGSSLGDLWRSGYHEGITHVHHFYTRRNLIATAALWQLLDAAPPVIRPALRFWASSYNASHSTLMTRVVAKQNHDDLVLTSAQPGVLYISGLPVEKNIFLGLRRKLTTIAHAFRILADTRGSARVVQGSGAKTDLREGSVDYAFMDPPFGGNIPYSEVNFISEAWLHRVTHRENEAIVSPAQAKGICEYQSLLAGVFAETRRILKPKGSVSVVFHSTEARVWNALVNAYTAAGFAADASTILDKRQGSFKQVTTNHFAKGDPLILLSVNGRAENVEAASPDQIIKQILAEGRRNGARDEMTPHRLYSRFVAFYVQRDQSPPMDAARFYALLAKTRHPA